MKFAKKLTDWLTDYSYEHNSIQLRLQAWFFLLLYITSALRSAFWHTAVRTMYSSWTYQCPLLCPIYLYWQRKVLIWWYMWWLPLCDGKIVYIFIVATLILICFWYILLCNRLNLQTSAPKIGSGLSSLACIGMQKYIAIHVNNITNIEESDHGSNALVILLTFFLQMNDVNALV